MLRILYLLFALLITAVIVGFILLNKQVVEVNLFISQLTLPVSFLLIASFVLGCFFSMLLMSGPLIKLYYQRNSLLSNVAKLEKKLESE